MLELVDGPLEAVDHGLDDLHSGPSLLLARHQRPGSELVIGSGEHLVDRCVVEIDLVPVAPVLVGEFPAPERVVASFLESPQLLLGADVEPELDDDESLEREVAFELDDLVVGAAPLWLCLLYTSDAADE